jgi:hypothetical protein
MTMADSCGSDGIYAMMAVDDAAIADYSEYDSTSPCFPLLAEGSSLIQKIAHVNTAGLNGEVDEDVEQTREGFRMVEGDISLAATPATIQEFMPRITGMAWNGSSKTWPVKTLPGLWHTIIHKDAKVFEYQGIAINQFVLSSSAGEITKFVLSCMGKVRASLQSDWPSGLLPSILTPYMHADAVVTYGGSTVVKTRSFTLTHNKNLGPRHFDSNTPCGFKRNGKTTTSLQLAVPMTATTLSALLDGAVAPAYLTVQIVLTHPNGNMSTTIDLPGWQIPPQDPGVNSGEILLTLDGTCRRTPGEAGARVPAAIFTNDAVA